MKKRENENTELIGYKIKNKKFYIETDEFMKKAVHDNNKNQGENKHEIDISPQYDQTDASGLKDSMKKAVHDNNKNKEENKDKKNILPQYDQTDASGLKDRIPDLEEAVGVVQLITDTFCESFKNAAIPPKSAELEFGIKLQAGAKIVLANVSTEGNLKLKMVWENNNESKE